MMNSGTKLAKNIFSGLVFLLLLSIFPDNGTTSTPDLTSICKDNIWPFERSEIAPDPTLVRGRFENGLRYVLKKNAQPAERVALYLNIRAGSLHETEQQRGLAHFLEHMMFNGSAHFPAGSLVKYFQSLGMGFGGDTNAHTSHTETVYHIVLPGSSEKELDSGLLVMADYARGALLEDKEIDQERGVILAEKRARNSATYRNYQAKMDFALRGTRYPERMVIGLPEILENADQVSLKNYYDSWYRPENMVVVIVGALEPQLAEQLVKKYFNGLTPQGNKPKCPEFGTLEHSGLESFYHYEPELGKINVSLESFWQLSLSNDSVELEKKSLLDVIGSMIMNHRLEKLEEEEKVPFVQGRYGTGDIINRIGYSSLAVEVDKDHWKQSLGYLVELLDQALQGGFSAAELERVKKEIIAQLDGRILTESTEDSRAIARRIIDHLNSNRVYQSAQQERALYGSLTARLNLEDVNQAFKGLWGHNSRLISVTGDIKLGEDSSGEIERIYNSSKGMAVVKTTSEEVTPFPYLEPNTAGKTAPKAIDLADLGAERLVFANGLIVNLKKSDFEKNRIRIRADFGSGKLIERHPGSSLLAEQIINGSGTGKMSQSALSTALAGSSVEMSFRTGHDSFSWTGSSLPSDFTLCCQLLHTLLVDPGFKVNVFRRVMKDLELWYQKIDRQVDASLPLAIKPFLAGYDYNFGLPPWQKISQLDFAQLSKWVQSFIIPKDLEISIVGDFTREEVIKTIDTYFSGLDLLPAKIVAPPTINFPSGKELDLEVLSSEAKSLIAIAWPTEGVWTIEKNRRLHILAEILDDRLRRVIREEMSASYSTNVTSVNNQVYNGYGYILAHMLVTPGTEKEIVGEVMRIAEELQKNGVTSEELIRAKKPMATSLQERIRTNQYWLNSVLSLSIRNPQQLIWPNSLLSDYANISKSDLDKFSEKYLRRDQAAVVYVRSTEGEKTK